MTTMTNGAADVAHLLPAARKLTHELGGLPSRNRLKSELRVGSYRARAILDALERDLAAEPTQDQPEPTPSPAEPTRPPAEPTVRQPQVAPGSPRVRTWPVLLLALPAFVAIWSGWVGLGELTGFGVVHPLPGIADRFRLNTAITLPIGVETYAAYALRAWLDPASPRRARRFARLSAVGSLVLGCAGQVAYHLLSAAGVARAPWPVTTAVACLPVAVLGMGAALAHLLHAEGGSGEH
jgi:hypothetical protein